MRIAMKIESRVLAALIAAVMTAFSSIAIAQDETAKQTLFTNVNVFDGFAAELAMDMNVPSR